MLETLNSKTNTYYGLYISDLTLPTVAVYLPHKENTYITNSNNYTRKVLNHSCL